VINNIVKLHSGFLKTTLKISGRFFDALDKKNWTSKSKFFHPFRYIYPQIHLFYPIQRIKPNNISKHTSHFVRENYFSKKTSTSRKYE